ncbi:Inosine/uridine-preferring nucleoside hydrolase [Pirellula staleyi DSM 6068]|uniref:Inosine/uridine-preferring nucleoside hydrolase n=1 Tax=Pirellula staleyi (strain ATCC 27377 / DSM 6068 / ICPB 4128) TaxID=530564 RepID=D2R500_PIRSD|nr:nucleoside hydrolase [Pirellula staleyi]ADB18962.1 Inosine/uridine-preferring nucleoside hydrolase [Pirellula staleyi DSM 6068]
MPRKVIIDCDPGIDDAVALAMALFDPRLEVVAVTAVAGNVSSERATSNVQAIVERLDPPRYPRLGAASPADVAPVVDARHLHGDDGLANLGLQVSKLARQHPSEKLICDEVRAAPGEVSILCLGPLTNVARALSRDPGLSEMIGRLIILGGSVKAVGNVTPCAEFNIYADPASARAVFRSPVTKTLIPLDCTEQVTFTLDLLEQLPPEHSRAGQLLRKLLPYAFRSYRREMGLESIFLHDALAVVAAVHPELFPTVDMAGDVETIGELTAGMTVFDRRSNFRGRGDMEVALEVDIAAATDCIVRSLAEAGRQT